MSVEDALRGSVCALMLSACGLVAAAEETDVDPEFIEYLGMWEESDEDWQMMEGTVAENLERQTDELPHGEESAENEDEG